MQPTSDDIKYPSDDKKIPRRCRQVRTAPEYETSMKSFGDGRDKTVENPKHQLRPGIVVCQPFWISAIKKIKWSWNLNDVVISLGLGI